MTVVVAAVFGNKGVISADSLVVSGSKKIKKLKNFSKLIEFPHFILGFGGDCSIHPVLRDFLDDKDYLKLPHMRMRNQKDALEFSKSVFEMLSGNLECSPAFDREEDAADLAELVILTKKGKIFHLDAYMGVEEHEDFCVVGSGEDLAKGAIEMAYTKFLKKPEELKQLVEAACFIACENNVNCGGDVITFELDF